jgi:sterol desaturase/sphingolipid hydroxylase (fatty acid hydroxylase superfamily)
MAKTGENSGFPWRLALLGPLFVTLFALAMYFYNNMQPEVGLALLGFAFAVPMVWVVLAAREADSTDSPLRTFIPRLTSMLVLGSAFLGYMMWNVNPRITAMEAGFVVFYIVAAALAVRIFNARPKRPQLIALSGGNQTPRVSSGNQPPRQRRRSR